MSGSVVSVLAPDPDGRLRLDAAEVQRIFSREDTRHRLKRGNQTISKICCPAFLKFLISSDTEYNTKHTDDAMVQFTKVLFKPLYDQQCEKYLC